MKPDCDLDTSMYIHHQARRPLGVGGAHIDGADRGEKDFHGAAVTLKVPIYVPPETRKKCGGYLERHRSDACHDFGAGADDTLVYEGRVRIIIPAAILLPSIFILFLRFLAHDLHF